MSRPTKNLTAPYAVRIRHDQRVKMAGMLNAMTDEQLADLASEDRSKFEHSGLRKGRAPNPESLIIRAALDEFIQRWERSFLDLPLFANINTNNNDGEDG